MNKNLINQNLSYSEKVTNVTCILCGAPFVDSFDKCSYCGALYLDDSEDLINLPETIELDTRYITLVKNIYDIGGRITFIIYKLDQINLVREWYSNYNKILNNNLKNNLLLNFKSIYKDKYILYLKDCFLKSIQINHQFDNLYIANCISYYNDGIKIMKED